MIPQAQRWFRGPVYDDAGEQTDEGGDCFAACLASILELPIDGFPNMLDSRPYGEGGWWHRWNVWLYENYRAELLFWESRETMPDPAGLAWWIAGVMLGDTAHSVLFYKDAFRWDPAPDDRKHVWTLDDVKDGVALFSIGSLWDRASGPYESVAFKDESRVEAA